MPLHCAAIRPKFVNVNFFSNLVACLDEILQNRNNNFYFYFFLSSTYCISLFRIEITIFILLLSSVYYISLAF